MIIQSVYIYFKLQLGRLITFPIYELRNYIYNKLKSNVFAGKYILYVLYSSV